MGRTFLGSTSCWSYVTLSFEMSVVTSCASVSERIHSSSSNCFVVGSFSCLSCVLSKKWHSSGKSPVAHLIVRMSRPWNKRLLWASSCEGDNGIQVFLPFTSRTKSAHWRQFDVEHCVCGRKGGGGGGVEGGRAKGGIRIYIAALVEGAHVESDSVDSVP